MAELIKKQILISEAINRTASLLPYVNSSTADTSNYGKIVYNLNYDNEKIPTTVKDALGISETIMINGVTYNILYYKTLLKAYFIVRELIENGKILRRRVGGIWGEYTRSDMNTLDVATDIHDNKSYAAIYTDELPDNITEALVISDMEKFISNGGLELFFFVRNEIIGYVRVPDNIEGIYVPEYVTYSEILGRLDELNKMKNPATCCEDSIFKAHGGQEMIDFLEGLSSYTEMQADKQELCQPFEATQPKVSVSLAILQEVLPLGEAVQDESENMTVSGETHDWYEGDIRIEGRIESKLSRVERRKRAYDDNGNELPFTLVNGQPEMIYSAGTKYNKHVNNGTTYADILTSIIPDNEQNLKFQYVLQGMLDDNGNYVENTGIKYEETFPYEIKTITATINNVSHDYTYTAITYENNEVTIYNEDNGLSRQGYIADANWVANDIWKQSGNTFNPEFREDYLIGITSPLKADIDVTVNRGKASAFERYMIMAECNTMEDLYNYKNNFFGL